MTGLSAARVYGTLCTPSAEVLLRGLPDIGDGMQAQLHELYARPSIDGAGRVAANLEGAKRAVLRLRERLIADGEGDGQ
jgi:hypothetical protein